MSITKITAAPQPIDEVNKINEIVDEVNEVDTKISLVVSSLLSDIYPVGSIYIGTQDVCPLSTLISGSDWTLVSARKALWTSDGTNANTTITAGLPNITGTVAASWSNDTNTTGAFKSEGNDPYSSMGGDSGWNNSSWSSFDASRSNSIYGNSATVQPPAYVVNVWRRTA